MNRQAIPAPLWLRERAVYQINPRTFSPEGTISAVTRELPFLKELGFGTMYLCPIFQEDNSEDRSNWSERQKASGTDNPKNPYRMLDYFRVDEEYGTEEDLRNFVAECHRLGLRVLLDLVYLHIGPNAAVLKTHPEFAQHDAEGRVRETRWHFPFLNFEEEGLREYLYTNMCYYVGAFDVDGFRCDTADGVPLDFWEEGRRRIRRIKKDAVLLNEGRNPLSVERAFDAIYGFHWHAGLYQLMRGELSAKAFAESEAAYMDTFPEGTLFLRDLDNHDTVTDWPCRGEAVAGHACMDLAEALNFTVGGIPMVYTGDELADETPLNMFANRFHPGRFHATDRSIRTEEYSLHRQRLIRSLNELRAQRPLLSGFTRPVFLPQAEDSPLVCFTRSEGGETLFFCGNFSKEACTVSAGPGTVLLSENAEPAGERELRLGAWGFAILARREA